MDYQFFSFLVLCVAVIFVLRFFWRGEYRDAKDVLLDLGSSDASTQELHQIRNSKKEMRDEAKKHQLYERVLPITTAILFLCIRLCIGGANVPGLIFYFLIGLSVGYLFGKHQIKKAKESHLRNLEFFLPIVMERLVMAVQAGLDVLPALAAITVSPKDEPLDPVSKLLVSVLELSEAGLGFEESLAIVANKMECPAVKHAFLHLSVAHKEGGELIMPLRELSDATQLYFQESREEELAKLPVRATLPLLCTFAGLILCFITSPLIQVITLLVKATPK